MGRLQSWDWDLFTAVNTGFTGPFLDQLGLFLSASSTWWIFTLFVAVLAWFLKRYSILKGLLVCAIAIAASDSFATYVGKPTLARVRPCYQRTVRVVANGCGSWHGLPSNHAANGASITAASSLFLTAPWVAVIGGVSFLVGLSRVYLGVHFPGDVLLGFLVGAGIGLLVKTGLGRLSFFRVRNERSISGPL